MKDNHKTASTGKSKPNQTNNLNYLIEMGRRVGVDGASDRTKITGTVPAVNRKSDVHVSVDYSYGNLHKEEMNPSYRKRRKTTLLSKCRRIVIVIGCIFVLVQVSLLFWNRVELQDSGIQHTESKAPRHLADIVRLDSVRLAGPQPSDNIDRFEPEFSRHDLLNTSAEDYSQLMPKQCRRMTLPKEVNSAVKRAVSLECRKEILNVACRHKRGLLYPMVLKSSCALMGENSGEYIGCYRDDKSNRILTDHKADFRETNSPEYCINYCLHSGFPYAGVQYTYECFCGLTLSDETRQLPQNKCFSVCPGDHSKQCGSYLTMNLYHTGFQIRVPQHAVYIKDEKSRDKSEGSDWSAGSIRIVFVLTVNGRAVRQVLRLLKAIYRTHHYYFIHVDKRQEYLYRELSLVADSLPNVRMSTERFSTIWGGASLLTMLLSCMKQLLDINDWHWDYFLNLSESDYPIKSVEELELFLYSNRGKNFVKSHGKDTPKFLRKQGLNMLFYECDNRMWRLGPRELQDGIRVDGGSDWICLYRNFTTYLTQSKDELMKGLKAYWIYTLLPAESFFHTVLQNSEFCSTVVNNNLHITNWRRKQGCKCQYKHIVDWCGCSPNDFTAEDFNKIQGMQGKPIYFGRKFEAIINQDIINKVDKEILKSGKPDLSFWLNEFHHLDDNSSVQDATFTHYLSLARSSVNHLTHGQTSVTDDCRMGSLQLLEGTIYKHRDTFQGLVVTYKFEEQYGDSEPVIHQMEAFYQPVPMYRIISNTMYPQRLIYIEVGNSYDPKEELFRNFASVLSPLSEVTIKLAYNPGPSITLNLVISDPIGLPASSIEITSPESTTVTIHTQLVDLGQPMLPGWWSVKLFNQWTLVAEYRYLILPLSHKKGREIDRTTALKLHSGHGKPYPIPEHNQNYLQSLLRVSPDSLRSAQEISQGNSERHGEELLDWIDELVSRKWMAAEMCLVGTTGRKSDLSLCGGKAVAIESCLQTSWSTKYPDPKSQVIKRKVDHGFR